MQIRGKRVPADRRTGRSEKYARSGGTYTVTSWQTVVRDGGRNVGFKAARKRHDSKDPGLYMNVQRDP